MKANKPAHIIGSISRTILALTFIFSGFVKAIDPLGTVYKVEDYLRDGFGHIFQWAMPLAGTIAVLLIVTELVLGICMLLNVRTRWTSWATLVFYLIMTPITLYIAIANPVKDCGCFGDALVLTNWQTFYKNIVLLVLAIALVVCNKSIPALFSSWVELIIALFAIVASLGLMGYCYIHLPIIDFRPYKVGNNIYELTQTPKFDKKEDIFLCVKDSVQKEFSAENYPKPEEGWKCIGARTTYFKYEGNQLVPILSMDPIIQDFHLEMKGKNLDGKDEYYILQSDEPVTLIVMYDLNKRNRKQARRAAELFREIRFHGGECYFLTGSGEEDIIAFAQEVGIDPDDDAFFFMDATPIKTIVRANPGIVIMQNGIVREKHNMRDYLIDDWRLDVDD